MVNSSPAWSRFVGKATADPGPNFHANGTKTWEYIAEQAYNAYAALTGNKNFRGDEMPAFGDLPLPIRTAWDVAVRQAVDEYTDERASPDVSRWKGWARPQDRPVSHG